jgi:hypothetical protein
VRRGGPATSVRLAQKWSRCGARGGESQERTATGGEAPWRLASHGGERIGAHRSGGNPAPSLRWRRGERD